jgi:acetyl esterase/lipase
VSISWLYLAATLVGLWFTKQALWPVPLPSYRAIPSFFAGWLTNELAFHHLAWQAAATGLFVWAGALEHWPGWLGLAVTVTQWVGIGVLIRRTIASKAAVQAALDDVLADFGEVAEKIDARSPGVRWGQLVLPLPIRHRGVVRERGLTFCRAGGQDLHLDVYRRSDRPVGRPVLLFVHGGAWMISNRNEQGIQLMQEMAARGWTGVNADYRLSPWATFPDHVVDVKRAIAWVREHAEEIGADPRFIALAGGSAGGHLAALAALTPGDPRFQPGFEEADTSIQACVPLYGVYDLLDRDGDQGHDRAIEMLSRHVMKATPEDDPELWRAGSPIDRITRDAPPFFIVHGSKDTLAPVATARRFAERLRQTARCPVGYADLPAALHAFDVFPSLRTAYVLDGIGEFLEHAWAHWRSVHDAASVGARTEG